MTIKTLVSAAVLSVAVAAPVAMASDFEDQIAARKAVMEIAKYNMGILGAMAKGKVEYNAELASEAATNMLAVASIKAPSTWPAGSDNSKVDDTKAKPEAWSNYEDVMAKHQSWVAASETMAANAGNGLDALRGSIGALGKSCKGCHSEYKAK